MRRLTSLKYHSVRFLIAYLFIQALISLTLGSFNTVSEAKCEYEDANLIWRNTPSYSFHDVKAMAWYKGKGSLMATWLAEKGFVEYPPYIGRLMQIGETGIKIRTANRSDNGTYWLSLTLASVDDKLEAATHLEVKVPPSNRCKPRITREGSILKADLASEGCGTPHLTPKWKHINTTYIKENSSSVLDLGTNPEPGEYMVCAEGESAKCYQGNISDLCTRYIKSTHRQNDSGLTPHYVSIILPIVLNAVLVPSVVVIWLKHSLIRNTFLTDDVQHPPSDHGLTPYVVTTILVVIALLVVFVLALVVVVMRCRHVAKGRNLSGINVEFVTENISSNEENRSKEMSTIEVAHMESSKEVQHTRKKGENPKRGGRRKDIHLSHKDNLRKSLSRLHKCVHDNSALIATFEEPTDSIKTSAQQNPILFLEQPFTKSIFNFLPGKVLFEIQNHLKKLYECLTTVPLSPIDDGKDHVNVSEVYTNIDFGKAEFADADNWESNASSCLPRDQQPLIRKDQAPAKQSNQFGQIYIFGDCGSGKSTWCKHLVKCWLQASDNKDANIQGLNLQDLRNIQIILYLPLQFSDGGLSLEELLEKYLFKEKSTYLEFLMNYVEDHGQDVLIIMDGLDTIRENSKPISELLHHKLLSSCNVIVTSRPASFKLLHDTCHAKIEQLRFFKVREMDIENSKIYAKRLLESINRLHRKNLKFENFWEFTEHLQVQSLLKVPYICLLLLHVWMTNKNNFIEVTDIMLDIIYYYLCRAMADHQRKKLVEKAFGRKYMDVNKYITKLNKRPLLIQYSYLLYVLSRVAAAIFSSDIERKTSELKVPKIFLITDEDRLDLQVICETGLLTESLSLSTNKKVSDLSFSDRIICEFFVSIFIALREGKDCDFIVSSGNASLQNSMIIHMLFQLSGTVVKDIMDKASKSFEKETTKARSTVGSSDSSRGFTYSITQKKFKIANKPILWLQWLMYNDAFHEKKLLFLTTALYFIDSLTSVVLEDHANNDTLVFWLPLLPTLETLTLNINSCKLLLCKEWYDRTQPALKQLVIKSVHINRGTLALLIRALGVCVYLEILEISPAIHVTDNNDFLPETSDLANFSWIQLSEIIKESKKLKSLKLKNLSLVGEVDTVVSRLNHYTNLETLELKNLSNIVQDKSSFLHSPGTARVKDNDLKRMDKISLKQLSLEKLELLHSPINFLFYKTQKGETKAVQNNFKVLRMSAVDMPPESWEKLGTQIGALKLSEVHLHNVYPRGSAQILLDGIGKCEELKYLSLINIDTEETYPFLFLKNLKDLSILHLELMNFAGPSLWPLFDGIRECKKLKKLSFCNTRIGEIPENLCFDLQNLSELTVDQVRITEESDSLYWLLDAFKLCKNLKTLSLKNVKKTDIPTELSNRNTLQIDTE